MFNRPYVAIALLSAAALLPTAPARAADVTVIDAKIGGGKLVITGTTAAPNTWVRLDGQSGADFNVKSGANGAFAFGVVYHPGDCIVELQRLISPTATGAAVPALVADCGPRGLSPRGAWSASSGYLADDLVTSEGSSWRAKRNSLNRAPANSPLDWELFAAAGAPGEGDAAATDPATGPEAPQVAPDGPAGGDLTGTYPNPTIANQAVTTLKIAVNAISAGRIAPGAVVGTRIAANAVTSDKIADGTIANVDIASGAVNSASVLDGSLTAADLGASSVGSSEIADGAVTGADVANSSLTGDDIASSSLTGIDVSNGSLTGSDILDESIATADLAISSVTSSRIATSAVTSSDVANRSLTTDDMDLAERSGAISVGAISNGRCTTISGSVSGALPGDVAILTTNGSLPNGMLVYAQRALTDAIHIKVCNLSGATSAAITDLPVRVLSIH